jgi:hypothetical protein
MSEQIKNQGQIKQFIQLINEGKFGPAQIFLEKIGRDRDRATVAIRTERTNRAALIALQAEQLKKVDQLIAAQVKTHELNKNTFEYCMSLLANDKNKVKAETQISVLEKALLDLNKPKLMERDKIIADILTYDPSQNEWAARFKDRCNRLFELSTEIMKPTVNPVAIARETPPPPNPNKTQPRKMHG